MTATIDKLTDDEILAVAKDVYRQMCEHAARYDVTLPEWDDAPEKEREVLLRQSRQSLQPWPDDCTWEPVVMDDERIEQFHKRLAGSL